MHLVLLFPTESVGDLRLFHILPLFWGLSEADTSASQGRDDVNATIINSSITDHFRRAHWANALLLVAGAYPWGDVGNAAGKGNKEHKANLPLLGVCSSDERFSYLLGIENCNSFRLESGTAATENTWLNNN